MSKPKTEVSPPFRWAINLILAGLVVELVSLLWLHHPLGFMFFMAFGFSLTGAGLVMFVYHLLLIFRTAWQEAEGDAS